MLPPSASSSHSPSLPLFAIWFGVVPLSFQFRIGSLIPSAVIASQHWERDILIWFIHSLKSSHCNCGVLPSASRNDICFGLVLFPFPLPLPYHSANIKQVKEQLNDLIFIPYAGSAVFTCYPILPSKQQTCCLT